MAFSYEVNKFNTEKIYGSAKWTPEYAVFTGDRYKKLLTI